ncbi:hypothetical protein [Desulfovibrio litoralis]|uniref:Uncharacterized protein n=1 Tax=Desulfovibrio litoralis DSM 11393 TaxID=1121455 RepID=A0A1M7T6V4_9BACT|nr:hypothetical protein [Desulfovibrio litoralis]SHN66481.1 hypothetical protein SAMN02745728_01654 [Desulfovibrio litoralis DSM 11393]
MFNFLNKFSWLKLYCLNKLKLLPLNFLHGVFIVALFITNILACLWTLNLFNKEKFIVILEQATQQKVTTPEALQSIKPLIVSRDISYDSSAIVIMVLFGLLGLYFMRWIAGYNWSWTTTLAKAIEFRAGMEQLGIVAPEDRIDFIRKNKIPVFIASSPLIGREQINVKAKSYNARSFYPLRNKSNIDLYVGQQTLCFDADNYASILQQHGQKTELAYSARVVTLEEMITNLKGVNSIQVNEIEELKVENKLLKDGKTQLSNQLKTLKSNDANIETSNQRRIPFWRVAAPMINKMIEEATSEEQYTRADIQLAFVEELQKYPDLQDKIKAVLNEKKQNKLEDSFELTGWAMDSIRFALGNFVKKQSGRPSNS